MRNNIDPSWNPILSQLYNEPLNNLPNILANISFQPKKEDIFKVFSMPLSNIKLVILGQDPYPNPGDATGLAFENGNENKIPSSLEVIYNEIKRSTNSDPDIHTWTEQGVFLLNTSLTVKTGKPGSHVKYWENFTQSVIKYISQNNPCIWMLWGLHAQKYIPSIYKYMDTKAYDRETIEYIPISPEWNYILSCPHPAAEKRSPNVKFTGCDHFYLANCILKLQKKELIKF